VSFGGTIEPAAVAPMLTDAWRLVLMSIEPDPWLKRVFWPEKVTGAEFAARVLLNEPTDKPSKV
jgi:hypothetical protein